MMHQGKRLLALLLVLVMVISMIPAAAAKGFEKSRQWASNQFSDVPEYQWYYDTVKEAYELGLMSGDPDGSFRPDGSVTLAETVAVASRIHAIHHLGEEKFVQGEVWYEIYVDYALQNGILEAALSEYNRPATRLEFARVLSRALPEKELKKINEVEDGAIPDVKDDEAVYLLYRAGVLTGNDDQGTFAPKSNIKRSEVAAIVARMALPELRKEITLKAKTSAGNLSFSTDSDVVDPEEFIDENNALTQPFDLVYPDLFASGEINYSGEQILIKLASKPTGAQQADLEAAGVTALEELMDLDDTKWYKAAVSGAVTDVMAAVRELDFVLVAEYDYVYETESIIECDSAELDAAVQGNKLMKEQWYLQTCGVKDGWQYLKHPHKRPGYDEEHGKPQDEQTDGVEAGEGIVVAVIDTGVDYTHPDLAANIWVNRGEIQNNGMDDDGNGVVDDYYGFNAVDPNRAGDPMDDHGHGTHVAGIVGAVNDDSGIVGIAYNSKIMAIKAGMASGYFNQSAVAEAIVYAYQNGADVINMSFGGSASSIAVQDALTKAYTRCVLVAAAGNDGMPNEITDFYPLPHPSYPAALAYVLGVMSVDRNGVESSFTNWDVFAFNSVEYEVCAPGSEMISTIPGGKYATWSGTSMAAPVVSAVAALVRSEFRDQNTYPTKFIYGQISGTGEKSAICCAPQKHTVNGVPHNLPAIVDVHNALTVLPKPDVGVTDYTVFDTVGLQGSTVNNGDGVIDAGETIALGFTLRNRWGKSENTVITVDSLSPAGIPDPYITIHNASVNVGQVGTYSTQDCGKLLENGAFVGWENPIYLTVASGCPNDYIAKLNVTVTCENALDVNDTAAYSSDLTSVNLAVRRGIILPSLIKEDMTLNAERYYIVPNYVVIEKDVCVSIEPGTQIQFWSDDPNDAYAENGVAYILVEGTLISEGTADQPVRMFPSQLKATSDVKIYENNGGITKLYYTEVINPNLQVTYAEECVFSQNYPEYSRGSVLTGECRNCAFYNLSGYSVGFHDGCIFIDSNVSFNGQYQNCVFYGNNLQHRSIAGSVSSFELYEEGRPSENSVKIVVDETSGTTYVGLNHVAMMGRGSRSQLVPQFAEYLGGTLLCINTEAEQSFIEGYWWNLGVTENIAYIGLERDYRTDRVIWQDGTEVGDFFNYQIAGKNKCAVLTVGLWNESKCFVGIESIEQDFVGYQANVFVLELPASNHRWTAEQIVREWENFESNHANPDFYNNAILNRLHDENDLTNKWLRVFGMPTNKRKTMSLAGNYWGTTNEFLINKQIVDFEDSPQNNDIDHSGYLPTVPENVWPVVTRAGLLDASGNETLVVGNETVTFYVEFNRDMDTSIPLDVRFGSAYPYADYQVEGQWVTARRWEGTTTLTTLIEGGYQLFSISNGKAADAPMKLYTDWGRFPFEIDTSEALAMTLQGHATAEGIQLEWFQDDFDTLMGYNVYRADRDEDAYYQRLNSSVIPVGEEEFFDSTVEPGKDYYYIFTVVKTDLTESEPSGKIKIQSLDTMAPLLYHTPVYEAYVGSNVVISATATDNLRLDSVSLHYNAGSGWKTVEMQELGGKYSALISGNNVQLGGVKYYITASDGVTTVSRGTEAEPFVITVKEPPTSLMTGDVNGDGVIGIADALLVLRGKNNKVVLTKEQFTRADLDGDGILSAAEALKILRYANGEINSLQ